jgi:hypothetical protein
MPFLLRFWPHIAGAVLLLGGLWYLHHHGYRAGQAERTAHYQPILKKIDEERIAASARVKALESAGEALSKETEQRHAETEKALRARAAAADERIARLVRRISRGHDCPVPEAPRDPAEPSGAAPIPDGLGGVGIALRALAERAVRDAERLAACQDFLRAERNLLN